MDHPKDSLEHSDAENDISVLLKKHRLLIGKTFLFLFFFFFFPRFDVASPLFPLLFVKIGCFFGFSF